MDVNKTRRKFKTVDLFAGIGGVRLGFESTGKFETVFANDFDKFTKHTYDKNFEGTKLTIADIRNVDSHDIPEFDLLLGGFPCQPFSIAGYQKGFADKGRGDLFFEIIRILKDRKPKAFMLENVKNLYTHNKGDTYNLMKEELKNAGYFVKEAVLNTMQYGNIPQNRERLYIVGFRNEKSLNTFAFPEPTPLTKTLKSVIQDNVDKKYYYNDKPLFNKLKDNVTKEGTAYQWRRVYVRENKSNVSPTLTANMGTGGHNVPIVKDKTGIRKLTPQECLILQGYPDWYKLPDNLADSTLYKQVGNSVSVPVISRIAQNIAKALL